MKTQRSFDLAIQGLIVCFDYVAIFLSYLIAFALYEHVVGPSPQPVQEVLGLALVPAGATETGENDPVQIYFLFLGPSNYMKRNLDFLASLSALFQTPGLKESLLRLTDAWQVLETIRQSEKR